MQISITETGAITVLRSFLLSVLPSGVEVIRSQVNRVPEPTSADFVLMTPILRRRLSTNTVTYEDTTITASIAGATLTVTGTVGAAPIIVGTYVFGPGVATGTVVTAVGAGGTYTVTPSQTVAREQMAVGIRMDVMDTEFTVQLDVHGPNSTDNIQALATLFRSEVACYAFKQSGLDMQPLYTSDPRQAAFTNGENQYEDRWTIDAVMQINPIVTTPQQFADQLLMGFVNVTAVYPAD
jgi:hypothetical protein